MVVSRFFMSASISAGSSRWIRRRITDVTPAAPSTPSRAAAIIAPISQARFATNAALRSDSRIPTDAVPMIFSSWSRIGTFTRQDVPRVPVCVPT